MSNFKVPVECSLRDGEITCRNLCGTLTIPFNIRTILPLLKHGPQKMHLYYRNLLFLTKMVEISLNHEIINKT